MMSMFLWQAPSYRSGNSCEQRRVSRFAQDYSILGLVLRPDARNLEAPKYIWAMVSACGLCPSCFKMPACFKESADHDDKPQLGSQSAVSARQ